VAEGTRSSSRNPRSALRTHNGWVRTSGLDSGEPFLDHLDAILEDLEPRQSQLERLTDQCILDLYCGYGLGKQPGQTTIDHARLQRLAHLPISLTFDVNGPNWHVPLIDNMHPGLQLAPSRRWNSGALAIHITSVSAASISSLLGPAATWPASGDVDGTSSGGFSALMIEQPAWVRESGLPRSAVLEDHLDALLNLGEAKAQAFHRLGEQTSIELRLCYASDWGQGGFGCEQATIKRLAALPFDLTIELTLPP